MPTITNNLQARLRGVRISKNYELYPQRGFEGRKSQSPIRQMPTSVSRQPSAQSNKKKLNYFNKLKKQPVFLFVFSVTSPLIIPFFTYLHNENSLKIKQNASILCRLPSKRNQKILYLQAIQANRRKTCRHP